MRLLFYPLGPGTSMNGPDSRSASLPSVSSTSIVTFAMLTPGTGAPVVGSSAATPTVQPPHSSRLGGSGCVSGCAIGPYPRGQIVIRESATKFAPAEAVIATRLIAVVDLYRPASVRLSAFAAALDPIAAFVPLKVLWCASS